MTLIDAYVHASAALCEPATDYALSLIFEYMHCFHPTAAAETDAKRPAFHKVVQGYVPPGGVPMSNSEAAGETLREFEWLVCQNDADRARFVTSIKEWSRWMAVSLVEPALLTEAGKAMKMQMALQNAKAPDVFVATASALEDEDEQ